MKGFEKKRFDAPAFLLVLGVTSFPPDQVGCELRKIRAFSWQLVAATRMWFREDFSCAKVPAC